MAMPPNFGRPGAGPSFLGGGASNANSLQSRLSGRASSMPFQSRSMPPPTGANGIASAFQGVNPARAGYDVGNAAIMAQQNRAMPSQQMAGLRPMGQPQEFGQIPQAAGQNAAPTQYSSPPPQLTSSQQARLAQQQQLQAPYLDLQNSIKNSPAEQYQSTASYLGGNLPDQFAPLDAYRQQQYNAEQAFRNQYASAAPGDLAELSKTYQNQQLAAGQQFEAQNPGLMAKYSQAVQQYGQTQGGPQPTYSSLPVAASPVAELPPANNSGTTFNPNAVYSMSPESLARGVAASEGMIPASMARTPPTQPQPSASTMSAINRANGGNMPAFAMGAPSGFGSFGGR